MFNFPYEIVRTHATVVHIFGSEFAKHTGRGTIVVHGGDDNTNLNIQMIH